MTNASKFLASIALSLASLGLAQKPLPVEPGQIVFKLDLKNPETAAQVKGMGAEISESPTGSPSLCIRSIGREGKTILLPVRFDNLSGARVSLTGRAETKDIAGTAPGTPKDKWAGVKFQLSDTAPGGPEWRDHGPLPRNFSTRDLGLIFGVSVGAKNGQLKLGLESATGQVCYADIQIVALRVRPERPGAPRTQATLTKKDTLRRGVMSPMHFNAQDFKDLRKWNVNLVRWQMNTSKNRDWSTVDWIDPLLDQLALALDAAKENDIQIVIDLHSPPGGREPDATLRMVLQQKYQDQFVAIWKRIATRFKGNPTVYGYDLINEPVQNRPSPDGLQDWLGIQVLAAKAIRSIDPTTPIIIEMDQWDSPESFQWLKPIDISNVIYQVHMYDPGAFTGQGVSTGQGINKDMDMRSEHAVHYPGMMNGVMWDEEHLRRVLQPVRDFQLATNSRIYCGEFSAARWSPGAAQWLTDVTSIFDEYGWDYTYHAFREWQGWSLEMTDLPYDHEHGVPSTIPTDRLQVMLGRYKMNKR
jgi:endoglucanase